MKATFFTYMVQQAAIDPNLYLITGDLGFPFAQEFEQKFPERFINAGIAEQNMIGVAAGLAMAGKNVYVYSIIPFLTMRCFEQIRIDLCYQKLPVKLIGAGGGFVYGAEGATHHAIEDIAIMRSVPNMTVIAPATKYELLTLLSHLDNCDGPAYVRISNAEECIPFTNYTLSLGSIADLISHQEHYIMATGNALDLGYHVQQILSQKGVNCGLASVHTIKPLDHNFFSTKNLRAVFTIEEHSVIGGLGQAVAHLLCEKGSPIIFQAFGIPDCYECECGSRNELKQQYGLTPDHIASAIMRKFSYEPQNFMHRSH
jgi:transketolase